MGHYDEYIVCIIMASLSNVLFREINRGSRIIFDYMYDCKLMLIITRG